jgi:hypothetical protein
MSVKKKRLKSFFLDKRIRKMIRDRETKITAFKKMLMISKQENH